jgi:hypothetical protein
MNADQEKRKTYHGGTETRRTARAKSLNSEGEEAERNVLDSSLWSFVSFVVKLLAISVVGVNQW